MYINYLPEGLKSNAKLFADDTSLFSIVKNEHVSFNQLKSNLSQIEKWAFQWKMQFNPDPKKPATEVIFSHRLNKNPHHPLKLNNLPVATQTSTKYLGMILDCRLDFNVHLDNFFFKLIFSNQKNNYYYMNRKNKNIKQKY